MKEKLNIIKKIKSRKVIRILTTACCASGLVRPYTGTRAHVTHFLSPAQHAPTRNAKSEVFKSIQKENSKFEYSVKLVINLSYDMIMLLNIRL